jgi:hypothetical protein
MGASVSTLRTRQAHAASAARPLVRPAGALRPVTRAPDRRHGERHAGAAQVPRTGGPPRGSGPPRGTGPSGARRAAYGADLGRVVRGMAISRALPARPPSVDGGQVHDPPARDARTRSKRVRGAPPAAHQAPAPSLDRARALLGGRATWNRRLCQNTGVFPPRADQPTRRSPSATVEVGIAWASRDDHRAAGGAPSSPIRHATVAAALGLAGPPRSDTAPRRRAGTERAAHQLARVATRRPSASRALRAGARRIDPRPSDDGTRTTARLSQAADTPRHVTADPAAFPSAGTRRREGVSPLARLVVRRGNTVHPARPHGDQPDLSLTAPTGRLAARRPAGRCAAKSPPFSPAQDTTGGRQSRPRNGPRSSRSRPRRGAQPPARVQFASGTATARPFRRGSRVRARRRSRRAASAAGSARRARRTRQPNAARRPRTRHVTRVEVGRLLLQSRRDAGAAVARRDRQ